MSEVSMLLEQILDNYSDIPIEHDPEWTSPCEVGHSLNDLIFWKPFSIKGLVNFDDVESATNIKLHSDVIEYFGSFFGWGVGAFYKDIDVSLRVAWNERDFINLKRDMIFHIKNCL